MSPTPAIHFSRSLDDPPGGVLMWLIVGLELLTFGIVFVMLALLRHAEPALVAAGQSGLERGLALAMTLVLLTSGLFAAEAVHANRAGHLTRARALLGATLICGLAFVVLKLHDARAHLAAGHGLGSGDFWDAYLLSTGFHGVHVVVGLLLLGWVLARLGRVGGPGVETVAAVGLFWHLCDLAWFFLFPLLYARN